ncbi:Proteasomal ATPase-associated factor 1 [Termitomyces sp. J132]|nr:hypothetical protein H2248_007654 [Termitomyces sp. 'cryptogamus']KNZ73084.1 Proteasomal ATPase-associated factor 1 [Termitomyces sp. J132]
MVSPDPITLPVVTIDPTYPTVIQDVFSGVVPSETFWISCYKASHPSVHAKIRAELHAKDRDRVVTSVIEGDLMLNQADDGKYVVSCESLGMHKTPVLPPIQEYFDLERSNPQRPQRITAFDVAPDSSRLATGFLDGSIFLYPTTPASSFSKYSLAQKTTPTISERAVSRPHLSTATHLQFFPSSRVLLSSGADFSLTVLPADLPEPSPNVTTSTRLTPVRILRAHTRPITSTVMIGPGRNVLSASLDGSLKLWDIPSSTVLASIPSQSTQPILSATLASISPASDPQSLVEGVTVYCGLQDGSVQLFDLRANNSVIQTPTARNHGGAAALAHNTSHHFLAVGSSKGIVSIYDTRLTSTTVTSFKRGEGDSGVEDLAFLRGNKANLVVATSDGLPYVANVLPDGPGVAVELVGGDCDPVRSVCVRETTAGAQDIWSAGDDAVVRRWRL